MMAFPSALLSRPRLPTPPADAEDDSTRSRVDEAIHYLDASLSSSPPAKESSRHDMSGQSSLDTPPSSSPLVVSSSQAHPPAERLKRLRFSAETSYCDAPVKPLPPSKEQSAVKSILKPFDPIVASAAADQTSTGPEPANALDFATMLDSILKELAGDDDASQLDAYSTLWRSIKAYENLPDTTALLQNLSALEKFLRRDICRTDKTVVDKKLKLQALQLASTLVWRLPPCKDSCNPSSGISTDFLLFLINQAVSALEEDAPKDVLRHQLVILTMQEAYAKTMNTERAVKILKLLSCVHERVKGSSIIQLRLMIYRQMAQYHPTAVTDEGSRVTAQVESALTNNNRETRSRAIEAGLVLGTHVGQKKSVTHTVRAGLNDHRGTFYPSYGGLLEKRLGDMLSNTDDSHHVPQIWGVYMLLFRGDSSFLRDRLARKPWLKLIERCFNSSDTSLNLHAWTAWHRTIFAAQGLMGEHKSVLKKLCTPIFGHLLRESGSGLIPPVIMAAYSSYYLILYYAFGQSLNSAKTLFCWKHLVGEMSVQLSNKYAGDGYHFALALRALFADSTLKVWNSERGLQTTKTTVQWQEVPRLDPMWVRLHLGSILKSLYPLLDQSRFAKTSLDFTGLVWGSMMKAISRAGEKEIKASNEFRRALAEVVNYLCRFWSMNRNVRSTTESSESPITVFFGLARSAIDNLGAMQWGENIIVRAPNGVFQAANTSSKIIPRTSDHAHPHSAIDCLVGIVAEQPPEVLFPQFLRSELSTILTSCLEARPTRASKIEVIEDCVASLACTGTANQRSFVAHIWQALATLARSTLEDRSSDPRKNNYFGRQHYRSLLYILRFGLHFGDFRSLEVGRSLFSSASAYARENGDNDAFVAEFAEPWLDALTKHDEAFNQSAVMLYLSLVLDDEFAKAKLKSTEQDQTSVHKSNKMAPSASEMWPEVVASALGKSLSFSYAKVDALDASAVHSFLLSARRFLKSSKRRWFKHSSSLESLVGKIKKGLLLWVSDGELKIIKAQNRGYDIETAFSDLWGLLLSFATKLIRSDTRLLKTLEDVLITGFRTHNVLLANITTEAWNQTFQDCAPETCPDRLKHVLGRLQKYTNVHIPAQNQQADSVTSSTDLPSDDRELFPWLKDENREHTPEAPKLFATARTKSVLEGRTSLISPSTPEPRNLTPAKLVSKQTPPPRLRHDDSQIQFVAIDSSPADHATEQEDEHWTEHQKDVRSRQSEELAIFADLLSSPIPDKSNKARLIGTSKSGFGESHAEPIPDEAVPDEEPMEIVATGVGRDANEFSPDDEPMELIVVDADTFAHNGSCMDKQSAEMVTAANETVTGELDSNEGFVDAASILPTQNDIESDPSEKLELIPPSKPEDAQVTTSPLKDLANNERCLARSQDQTAKQVSANLEDTVERDDKIFARPSATATAQDGLDRVSEMVASGSSQAPESQSAEMNREECLEESSESKGLAIVVPSSSFSATSQVLHAKRGRKRKATMSTASSEVQGKRRALGVAAHDQAQEKGNEDDGDVIVLEDPDESSPSLTEVLGSLGIKVPGVESPSASQIQSRKRGRSDSTKPSQETIENSQGGRRDATDEQGPSKRRKSTRRSSQRVASEESETCDRREAPKSQTRGDATADEAAAVFTRLRGVIGEVEKLQLEAGDTSERAQLLELIGQLQQAAKAAIGDE